MFFHAPYLVVVPMKTALLTLGLALALVLPGAADAQVVPGNGAVLPMASSTVGNATSFSKFMGGLTNIDRFAVTSASDGTLLASTGTKLSTGAQVNVASRASKAKVAAAIGRFAGKALPIGYMLGAGVALYQLAQELGFTISGVPGAVPAITESVTSAEQRSTSCQAGTNITGSLTQLGDRCKAAGEAYWKAEGYASCVWDMTYSGTTIVMNYAGNQQHCGGYNSFATYFYAAGSTTTQTATSQDLADKIASTSGWPVSSALARTTVDAVKLGQETIELTPESITGPATTSGPTSTKTEPNGNVTTTTTTKNYNYAGDTVTVTTNTSTAVYNPTTQTTETTTETSEPEIEPKDPCESNPDRIACAEFGTPEPETLKDGGSGFTPIVSVPFASSAGCPAPLSMSVMGNSYEISYGGTCDALDTYLKPLLLLLAAAAGVFIFTRSFAV